jgi:hypothetical protein
VPGDLLPPGTAAAQQLVAAVSEALLKLRREGDHLA